MCYFSSDLIWGRFVLYEEHCHVYNITLKQYIVKYLFFKVFVKKMVVIYRKYTIDSIFQCSLVVLTVSQ